MRFAAASSAALQPACYSNGVDCVGLSMASCSGVARAQASLVSPSRGFVSGRRTVASLGCEWYGEEVARGRVRHIVGEGVERVQLGRREPARRWRTPRAMLQWNRRPELAGEVPRVVVITSGKGGVGKTTTTANLGMCLARLNFKVVAIDADVGLRNLDLLLGLENRVNYTAMEVLNGECRLDQALIRDKRWTNFELLCINKPRYKMPLGFGGKALTWLVDALRKRPEGQPHFILIDCPAGIDAGFITAITPAQEAILVTTPDITSLRDADRVTGLLECDGIKDIKMVVNRVRSDMIKGEDMMSVLDVQEMLGLPLLGVIPEDSEVIKSTNRGYPLVLKNPPSLAGLALEQMAWRLVEKDSMKAVMVEEAPPKRGFLQGLMGGKG
jgi:septum site-determining protein MinD